MTLDKIHKVFFVGIGGIGMSGLARWFHQAGYQVAGYDRTPGEITAQLQEIGIELIFEAEAEAIPHAFLADNSDTLVIYTPAIPASHSGLNHFKAKGFTCIKRAKALGLLVNDKVGLAVAGTHGKTSVSTTLATILHFSSMGCSAFVGGLSKNFQSNVLIDAEAEAVVVEADEFDRSFLTLFPHMAVITSMDADHLDIYGHADSLQASFADFVSQIKPDGVLLLKKGLHLPANSKKPANIYRYALDTEADYFAKNIRVEQGKYHFDLVHPQGVIDNIELLVPGLYNVENAIAAAGLALQYGVKPEELKLALARYAGVKRRFDLILQKGEKVFIDDYAHHPAEIQACEKSLRNLYPDKEIAVVFQPHLYTRTRDFADDFASALSAFDQVILTDLYPAREEAIEGVSSTMILERMQHGCKTLVPYEKLAMEVAKLQADVIVSMGAGDIDKMVEPIKQELLKVWEGQHA